jgi:hypothetical protein
MFLGKSPLEPEGLRLSKSDTKDDSTVFTIITKAIDLRGVCVGSVAQ